MSFSGFGHSDFFFDDEYQQTPQQKQHTDSQQVEDKNAYTKIFQKHPSGHHEYNNKQKIRLQLKQNTNDKQDINIKPKTNEVNKHFEEHHNKTHTNILNSLNELFDKNVSEKLDTKRVKYSHLANVSYETYYKTIEKANDYLKSNNETNGFKIVESLTNKESTVLHNPITKETHVSYRGTDPTNIKDVGADLAILTALEKKTKRYKNAENKFIKTVEKFGKDNITVSGHSLGGGQALHVAEKFGIKSYTFNPAVSARQVVNSTSKVEQNIYRTLTDVVSVNSLFGGKNRKINHVRNSIGKENLLDSHKLDHFFDKSQNKANYLHSSLKGLSHALNTAGLGYAMYQLGHEATHQEDPKKYAQHVSEMSNPYFSMNLDPDYQWSDEEKPTATIDRTLYDGVQPIKNFILNHTPWGKIRKRQNEELKKENITMTTEEINQDFTFAGKTYTKPETKDGVDDKGRNYTMLNGVKYYLSP